MQGPVKHNALRGSFGWVWQSNFSSVGAYEALYFTNSTALRAALPCKISSRFFILPAAGPLIARALAPDPGMTFCFSACFKKQLFLIVHLTLVDSP